MTNVRVVKKGGSWENEADHIEVVGGVFTIPTGGATIIGLKPGEYTLEETAAPDGYIMTLNPVKFKIVGSTVTYQNAEDNPNPRVVPNADNTEYTVQNEPGAELPSTGGPGSRRCKKVQTAKDPGESEGEMGKTFLAERK